MAICIEQDVYNKMNRMRWIELKGMHGIRCRDEMYVKRYIKGDTLNKMYGENIKHETFNEIPKFKYKYIEWERNA